MFAIVFLLVFFVEFFIVILFTKPRCPDCGGKMDDVDLHDDRTVYKCRKCGKEWI